MTSSSKYIPKISWSCVTVEEVRIKTYNKESEVNRQPCEKERALKPSYELVHDLATVLLLIGTALLSHGKWAKLTRKVRRAVPTTVNGFCTG